MEFEKETGFSQRNPYSEEMDHLSYLKRQDSLFKSKTDIEMEKADLICSVCGQNVTKVNEKVEIRGRHNHSFRLYQEMVHLGCFRNAPGCLGVERISNGYSWFRGYAWQIQVCRECYSQLGWKYISQDDSFYGIMFRMLREKISTISAE